MTPDDLEEALIAWGRVYGTGRASEYAEDRSLTGNSTLARIMGRPKQESTVGRDGRQRRMLMGDGRMIPMWACDPVPGAETRSHRPEYDRRETPVMSAIQTAWLGLHRRNEAQATAIRLHYQRRDMSREEKARALGMTVHGYREAIKAGRSFLFAVTA